MESCPITELKTPIIAHVDVSNTDRISNLPAPILELILSHLPIRDIVRTSILSSNWRNKWVTVPKLVFDYSCSSAVIDHVLLSHTGPIEIFKIKSIRVMVKNIDHWVVHACRRSVKELVIGFFCFRKYKLPSCLSKCESLVKLKLSNCLLILPRRFEGFKSLKCLCLECGALAVDELEKLISSCPMLETLKLVGFRGCRHGNLKINAPSLRHLDISGDFCNITFGHPMDRLLVFYFTPNTENDTRSGIRLTEILTNLPSIQQLALNEGSLSGSAPGLTPDSVPIQCNDLCHLAISPNFGCLKDCLAALYLFRSSPNLTELEIGVISPLFRSSPNLTELEIGVFLIGTGDPGLWGDTSKCYWEFRKLRRVKMEIGNTSESGGELKFIQFLLFSSPVLEEMTLVPCEGSNRMDWKDVKQIWEFKRASAVAKIIFDGHLIQ